MKPAEVKPTQARPAAPSSAFKAKTTEVAERLVASGERADTAHAPARGLGFEDSAPSFGSLKEDQLPNSINVDDLSNQAMNGSYSSQTVFLGARKTGDDRFEVLIESHPSPAAGTLSDEQRAARTTYTKFVVTSSGKIESAESTDASGTPKAAPPVASKPTPQTPTVDAKSFALKPTDLPAFVDQDGLTTDMNQGDFSTRSTIIGGRNTDGGVEVLVARAPLMEDAMSTSYGVYTVKPDGKFSDPRSVKLAE
jgi:hypothetical protein